MRSRMKWSMGLRGQVPGSLGRGVFGFLGRWDEAFGFGIGGRTGAMNAQCCSNFAPCSIHLRMS